MNKYTLLATILGLVMIGSMLVPAFAAPPPITDQMTLYEATIEGGSPADVDPGACYDTASAEMIFNVYDVLVVYNAEHYDQVLPSIATNWTITAINETSDEGLHWYYRYNFTIRTGVKFAPPYNYSLTPADVEYSFERTMVMDWYGGGGPQWMLTEPLLNTAGGVSTLGDIGNSTNPGPDVALVGAMVDHAVESSSTNVWFNIAFPGAYAPFMQILTQSWSSIMSKQWIINHVIGDLGRPDWDGTWGDYTGWIEFWNPETSPLEDPDAIMYGSGPFMLQTFSIEESFWLMDRHVAYWRGWPADYPVTGNVSPRPYGGYVDHIKCTWALLWPARKALFVNGLVDFCAVPPANRWEIHQDPDPEYQPPNYPLNGIQCILPLTALSCDALFFQHNMAATSPYQAIGPDGVFDPNNIPGDFFGNATWGMHVRKGFIYAFDYERYLQEGLLGDAVRPATAIIPGLPGGYYDDSIVGYSMNLTRALEEFHAVPNLWETGFTLNILYNTGNVPRQTAANILKANIDNMNNTLFTITITNLDWTPYLRASYRKQQGLFIIGWLLDYPDAHNFALPFYGTYGTFAYWSSFSNAEMDALISAAIALPDGPLRAAKYSAIQQLAVDLCPSVVVSQPIGRHYQRDWVVGWYFNPVYPGNFFYNMWKWYYVYHALLDTSVQPYSYNLGVDINYDGSVDIKDVSAAAKSFGSNPEPPINPRWVFRADFNGDRTIDIKDISSVAKRFGAVSAVWSIPV